MSGAMAAITAVFTVIALLLEAWAQLAPQRKEEAVNEEIQRGRRDIESGDAGAVAARLDRVLTAEGQNGGGGNAGGAGGEDPEGGAVTIRRLAALGIGPGETPRGGGTE